MNIVPGRFDGGPVYLSKLAASICKDAETIELVVEPFPVRTGLLTRSPRGPVPRYHLEKVCSRDTASDGALARDDI